MLGEELVKGGMTMVKARFLGDNLVMLTPREGEVMEDILEDNKEWFESVFSEVKPWSVSSSADHKLVWVKCYGLPLPFWNRDCFSKVVGHISATATMVAIDKSTLIWEVLEYARLLVRVQNLGSVRMMRRVKINKHVCSIYIEEEVNGSVGGGCNGNQFTDESSDSVSSSETYVEDTDCSAKSGEEKVRRRAGKDRWTEGGDGGKEDLGDTQKSNDRSKGCRSKSADHQGKGEFSFTEEERLDQNVCDILPDLAYEGCDSNPKLADLAKMVVDIECLSNQKAISQELGRVNKSGNQL